MKKIALIEDDNDLYNLVQYNLDKEGFQVVGSQTGKGALDLCRREHPDLVILDIMLPDSDGLEICKGIRANTDLANTPVIFLTARASETRPHRGSGTGRERLHCQAVFCARAESPA